jgi:hypothetical protein
MELEGAPEVLRWRSHPARERPVATFALLVIMLAASWGAVQFGQSLWWGIVGFIMLALGMWSYLLPADYRMDAGGVTKKSFFGTERRNWREVRSTVTDRWGILLSPFPHPTRLAKFRGLSVQFSPGNREDVIAFVQARAGSEPSA